MAINISVSGTSGAQNTEIGNAFDAIPGRGEAGLTKAQWVERCLVRYLKVVVKGYRRSLNEVTLTAVDSEYPEV